MTEEKASAWRLGLAAGAAALAIAALGVSLIYRISTSNEFRKQTTVNCLQVEQLKVAISDVLRDARRSSLSRIDLKPDDLERIASYYQRQLERFQPKPCT